MGYSQNAKRQIFDATAGRCHLCGQKLSFKNYAREGCRGAWEIDHSKPRANGGSNRRRNLLPAHIPCNRSKAASANINIRQRHGFTRKPLSKTALAAARGRNTWIGGIAGLAACAWFFGPAGALVGAGVGALVGNSVDPG